MAVHQRRAWAAEEGEVEEELLTMKPALVEVAEAVEQEKKLVGEVEEEERRLQEVVAQALMHLVEEEEAQVDHCFHSVPVRVEEEVAAFLRQQHLRLGKKNLLGVAEEGHQNEQVVEAALKIRACPRKEAVHRICLLKVAENQHRLPTTASLAAAVGEVGQE